MIGQAQFLRLFNEKKGLARILILGDYRTETAFRRLVRLRDCLRALGFVSTMLVSDHPDKPEYDEDPDIHNALKSEYLIMNWAEILIFVYFVDAGNVGVTDELEFTIQKVRGKLHDTVVMFEGERFPSSIIGGRVKVQHLLSDSFSNDVELCEKSKGYCRSILTSLIW